MLLSYRNGIVGATLPSGGSAQPGRNRILLQLGRMKTQNPRYRHQVRDGKEKPVAMATVTLAPVEKGK
jgi:hypothetical protein